MEDLSNVIAGKIFASLHRYAQHTKAGQAYMDNIQFVVNLPNRKSFNPDVAFYVGPRANGKFLQGAPVFAVEVRSKDDYSSEAEQAMSAKRRDYFAAGTCVIWDVDALKAKVVRVYRAKDPNYPRIYRCGEIAEAEPALPGWILPLDDLFTDERVLVGEDNKLAYSEDGVDLTLIRWMLSMTPAERLQTLQRAIESIMKLRDGKLNV